MGHPQDSCRDARRDWQTSHGDIICQRLSISRELCAKATKDCPIVASEDSDFERHSRRWNRHNRGRREEEHMAMREWIWYSKVRGQHALCGREWPYGETYSIKAVKKDNQYIIDLGDIKEQDKEDTAG